MMGFKDFRCVRIILSGIETMHMIRKGQSKGSGDTRTAAAPFYSLAAQGILHITKFLTSPNLSRHNPHLHTKEVGVK